MTTSIIRALIFSIKQFSLPDYINPEYELVAMHPEHSLPLGSVLPIYSDPTASTDRTYVPAQDRFLRESPETSSPRLPAFRHTSENRHKRNHLNVFLVAMNAEIKFRRYLEKIRLDLPLTPLPDDILQLMHRTQELIELIYWEAKPTMGSQGEVIMAEAMAQRQRYRGRAARPDPAKGVEANGGGKWKAMHCQGAIIRQKAENLFGQSTSKAYFPHSQNCTFKGLSRKGPLPKVNTREESV